MRKSTYDKGGATVRKSAKRIGSRSERVVIDSIFDDGTVRILRAKRKKDRRGKRLDIDAWEPEKEQVVKLAAITLLLRDELTGGTLQEGDVLFLADGDAFFERKIKKAGQAARRAGRRGRPRAEHLLCRLDEARDMARQEIKREFTKLAAGQGMKEGKAKRRLFKRIDRAMDRREKMESGLRRPQAREGK
jgi:hypothetical protein